MLTDNLPLSQDLKQINLENQIIYLLSGFLRLKLKNSNMAKLPRWHINHPFLKKVQN